MIYVHVSDVHHMPACIWRGQKKALETLKLDVSWPEGAGHWIMEEQCPLLATEPSL